MAAPMTSESATARATGTPLLTHSTARTADDSPLTDPTDRSISATSSTHTTPRAMTPTGTDSSSTLERFWLDRKIELSELNTIAITTSPATTGRIPRSPSRRRRASTATVPRSPSAWLRRSSCRSVATAGAALGVSRSVMGGALAGRRSRPRAPRRSLGHDVVACTGDGGHDLLLGDGIDLEHPVVTPEAKDHHAVRHRLHVGHVVADHDHAVPALAEAFDQVEHLGGLGDAERGGGLVEDDDLRISQQRAGVRDRRALTPRERCNGDADSRNLGREFAEQLPRAHFHLDLVEP